VARGYEISPAARGFLRRNERESEREREREREIEEGEGAR